MNEIFKYTKNNGEVIITGLQEGVGKTAIVIPEKIESMPVTEIAEQAFLESPITDVKIGKNIKRVGYAAFSSCHNLKSVTWNAQCGIIPEECFQFCFILSSFDFTKIWFCQYHLTHFIRTRIMQRERYDHSRAFFELPEAAHRWRCRFFC